METCKFPFSFIRILTKSDATRYLEIPAKPGKLLKELGVAKTIEICVEGDKRKRKWPTSMHERHSRGSVRIALSRGWRKFITGNKLKPGNKLYLTWKGPKVMLVRTERCTVGSAAPIRAATKCDATSTSGEPVDDPGSQYTTRRLQVAHEKSTGAHQKGELCTSKTRIKLMFYVKMKANHLRKSATTLVPLTCRGQKFCVKRNMVARTWPFCAIARRHGFPQ
ncbi:hypothetical protein L7F22_005565 [Adiantum nelumboides]|nr:hypothetical protein [Adiantum nelumboides]